MATYVATKEEARTTARMYERARQLRLARIIAPTFGLILIGVLFVSIAATLVSRQSQPSVPLIVSILSTLLGPVCVGLYGFATYAAWHDQPNPAITCIVLATAGMVVGGFSLTAFGQGNSAFTLIGMMTTMNVIVLAAVLTVNIWVILGVTALASLYVIAFQVLAVPAPGYDILVHDRVLTLTMVVAIQWVLAALLVATGRTYVATLRELTESRMAIEHARKLDALKDQFITSVNHELRTPAMAVRGYLDLIKLTREMLTVEEFDDYLNRATDSSAAMIDLLNTILDTRRIETANITYQPERIIVRDVIARTLNLISPGEVKQVERTVEVNIAEGWSVWADPTSFQQIILNLVTNAVKYSDAPAPIVITGTTVTVPGTHRQSRESKRVGRLTVRDFGLGIPPAEQTLLFNRFVRLPRDLASNIPGNGLGLHICKVLAEGNGGRIWIESSGIPGEGTAMHLELPLPE